MKPEHFNDAINVATKQGIKRKEIVLLVNPEEFTEYRVSFGDMPYLNKDIGAYGTTFYKVLNVTVIPTPYIERGLIEVLQYQGFVETKKNEK